MKLKLDREGFVKTLGSVASFAGRENLFPILATVLLEADANELKLTCTDMETGLISRVPSEVAAAGSGCLPAARLLGYTSGLESSGLELYLNGTGSLQVSAGRNKAKFPTLDASGYPDLPEPSGPQYELPAKEFLKALQRALISTARTDGMVAAHRSCIHFEPETAELVLTSADDHRLTLCRVPCGDPPPTAFDLHRDSCTKLYRILKSSSSNAILMYLSENHAWVSIEGSVVIMRRTVGVAYPSYTKRILKREKGAVVTDSKSLLRAIQSACAVSDQNSSAVDLEITADEILVRSAGQAGEVSNSVACVIKDGAPGKMRINRTYLTDFLSLADGPVGFYYPRPSQNEFWIEGNENYRHFIAGMHI
jgi:DNA polymerase-3 subunit beta